MTEFFFDNNFADFSDVVQLKQNQNFVQPLVAFPISNIFYSQSYWSCTGKLNEQIWVDGWLFHGFVTSKYGGWALTGSWAANGMNKVHNI